MAEKVQLTFNPPEIEMKGNRVVTELASHVVRVDRNTAEVWIARWGQDGWEWMLVGERKQ